MLWYDAIMDALLMRDAIILALSERLYICSRLLTTNAEKLGWDCEEVQKLIRQLRKTLVGVDEDASS